MLSTDTLRQIASRSEEDYTLLRLSPARAEFSPDGLGRLISCARAAGAPIAYADFYEEDGRPHPLTDCQKGSVRDDFDFGHAVVVNTAMLREALEEAPKTYRSAGWYDVRLRLSRRGLPLHVAEPLYRVARDTDAVSEEGESQFAYVDPRNREAQIEMEEAFTDHLHHIGAWIDPAEIQKVNVGEGQFPAEASVIIPVRNRVRTILDAVGSALAQETDFPFNVIAVDNGSTDGTLEALRSVADPRLVIIDASQLEWKHYGIGGCWNLALRHPLCGRFAVQLDSDDLYSGPDTLSRIVEKFYEEQCGMVVGSYTLTDFDRNVLPPGLIDHREWTAENGRNNALRINGFGAPRAFYTPLAREILFPDTCYGEDYAMALAISRSCPVGRIFDSLYLCRRWEDNTDHALSQEHINRNNHYKDLIRTLETERRISLNRK
ncbi:MAG: glycosyltransferase [Duncaniella sp.]|nr:glycosyltransferase [Duncaniella sp.]